jgi:hypothetical protein
MARIIALVATVDNTRANAFAGILWLERFWAQSNAARV